MNLAQTDVSFEFIDSTEELQRLCLDLTQHRHIAVDTEFLRERSFYPRVGLIQIATTESIYLIDPLCCDLTPFVQVIENPYICKIMHSMSEDLDVFLAIGAFEPNNFFDTQVAASWLGGGLSLSLQKLVQNHIGTLLNKSQTRTNWLKRPLSDAQLSYAAEDVQYLLTIHEQQQALLTSIGFKDYLDEENKLLVSISDDDHDLEYLHHGRAATMDRSTLNRYQRLLSWRERVARRDDKPKPHLLKDNDVSSIASMCDSKEKLSQYKFHPAFIRRYLAEITAVLFEANDVDLRPVKRLQDIPNGKRILTDLKQHLAVIAQNKGIPEEVMPSKRLLEQILKHLYVPWYPRPRQWSGWRKSFILQALDELNISIIPLSE